jgi:hypothetical protein
MVTTLSSPSIFRAVLVTAAWLVAACGDPAVGPTTAGSSDSGDTSTTSGPPQPSSSSVDSSGTSATSGGSSSSGSTSSGSTSSGSTSDASTGSTSDASTGSTSDASTGSTSDASTGTTGGEAGYCGQVCADAMDCAAGGNPADWSCTDGFCEYVGVFPPCDDTTCPAVAGLACDFVDGNEICTIPCTMDDDCALFMLECTGVTDMGDMICQSPPCNGAAEGAPCDIMGAGQFGVCTDGLCTCTDDSECTYMGYACNA